MQNYTAPSIVEIGHLADLTLAGGSTITKNAGSGDVIVIGTTTTPVPGGGVISVT
jgi:hypothetical protein